MDGFAIYCQDNDNIYYVPTKETKGKTFNLKVTEHKRGYKLFRSASNYLDILKLF